MKKNIKIAIIHDSFLHHGGAEEVFFRLIQAFPKADVFISLLTDKYRAQLIKSSLKSSGGRIYRSVLSKLPWVEKYASLLKPLILIYWELLDLSKYDLIISSSHSFSSKSVNKAPNSKHVAYIHTPPKYLYEEFNEMYWIKTFPFNLIFWPILALLRKYDYYSAQKPDLIVANSKTVQRRIKKYYDRSSLVVYPKHQTAPTSFKKESGKYYLFFSRLEKQKGAELVVKTCTTYNLPLVVVGKGNLEKHLKKIAGKTVFFTGFITEQQKQKIFAHCKALLFAAIDEDYGMVIPEVLSYGIPVIGYNSGAVKEIKYQDGSINKIFLFNRYSENGLLNAINKYHKSMYNSVVIKK